MPEVLLSRAECAKRLGISTRSFSRYKPKLCARGLQAVRVGKHLKYREVSLDTLIRQAAEDGGDIL